MGWLARMVTAMPAVNPTVAGCGIWRISEPSRSTPIKVSIAPESSTVRISPSVPNRAMVAATSTMKAPAGPPIRTRLPPSADTRKPPTIAV